STGKRIAAGSLVGQFHTLTICCKDNGVIADDITPANGVYTDFIIRSFSHQSFAAVPGGSFVFKLPCFRKDLSQSTRRSTGRILFQSMMHFDNFQIEARPEDL